MGPQGLISANRKQRLVSGVRSVRKIPVKPEPATLDRVHVLKVSRRAGILSCLSALLQSEGWYVILEAIFWYILSKSLNIPAAIIKSNVVTIWMF